MSEERAPMSPDREMAVKAMQSLGWTAKRDKRGKTPVWEFQRPDTGGLWDVATVRQDQLSMSWVAEMAMSHGDAPELISEINEAKQRWMQSRFLGLISRAAEQEAAQ